ncbi:hypothetical protein EVAR_62085_1 [Eumeta japonica]|uniref:Uncharacterized protein n=1 Tax=Eumeta variegata TaxID=151549 RepID=A0A4C1YZU3_EUMVA|nr:hypothetical protein EVAR_62085_1 [Eumeta japonica]
MVPSHFPPTKYFSPIVTQSAPADKMREKSRSLTKRLVRYVTTPIKRYQPRRKGLYFGGAPAGGTRKGFSSRRQSAFNHFAAGVKFSYHPSLINHGARCKLRQLRADTSKKTRRSNTRGNGTPVRTPCSCDAGIECCAGTATVNVIMLCSM